MGVDVSKKIESILLTLGKVGNNTEALRKAVVECRKVLETHHKLINDLNKRLQRLELIEQSVNELEREFKKGEPL